MTNPTPPVPVDPVINPPAPVDPPKPADPPTDFKALYDKLLAEQEAGKKTVTDLQKERDAFKSLIEKISGALNPDNPPDPEKLSKDLQDRDAKLKEKSLELSVMRHGGEHANTLLDSRKFMNTVNALDPDAKDFEDKLKAAIEENKPKTTTRSSGGADLNGGGNNGGKKQLTREQLKGMSTAEINKAKEDGLLNDLLAGKV